MRFNIDSFLNPLIWGVLVGFGLWLLVGCGNAQTGANSSVNGQTLAISQIQGNWRLLNATCNGTQVSGDMQDSFTVSGNVMTTSDISNSSNCSVQGSGIQLNQVGSLIQATGGNPLICSQILGTPPVVTSVSSCSIPLTINGVQASYSCPNTFPMFLDGQISYSQSGNNILRTVTGPDKVCQYLYGH